MLPKVVTNHHSSKGTPMEVITNAVFRGLGMSSAICQKTVGFSVVGRMKERIDPGLWFMVEFHQR
jgi:hypothetical protein